VVLAIAACNNNPPMGTHKSTLARTPIETKTVSNTLGKVEVPLKPQRVIVLEENVVLDSVVALGIKPVGVVYCGGCEEKFRGIRSELLAGVPVLGSIGSLPSLEKILALKPDLILGLTNLKSSYLLREKIPFNYCDLPFAQRL